MLIKIVFRKNNEVTPGYGFTEAPVKPIVTQAPKIVTTTSAPVKPGMVLLQTKVVDN